MLNWKLIGHPLNWASVVLMLLIAGIALHLILSFYQEAANSPAQSTVAQ